VIASTQADLAALEQLVERVYEERALFVSRNRRRLVKEATRETESARARYLAKVDEAEQARGELIANRQTEIWAAIYPADELASQPASHALCGGLQRPVEAAIPGLKLQLPAFAVFTLLREDGRHLTSIATTEQAALLRDTTVAALTGREAIWSGSPEDLERERREKERARAAHEAMWGKPRN